MTPSLSGMPLPVYSPVDPNPTANQNQGENNNSSQIENGNSVDASTSATDVASQQVCGDNDC